MEDLTPCALYTAINVGLRCQSSRIQLVAMNNENSEESSNNTVYRLMATMKLKNRFYLCDSLLSLVENVRRELMSETNCK